MFHKRTILIARVVSLVMLVAFVSSVSAASPATFFCSRAIEFDRAKIKNGKTSLVIVPITADVYRVIDPSFADMRVFDDEGNPTACLTEEKDRDLEYRLPDGAIEVKTDKDLGETLITIHAEKCPLGGIHIHTPDRNFKRKVVLEASSPRPSDRRWTEVSTDEISRIDLDGVQEESLYLAFPEQRASKLQLHIIHGENRPIVIESVQLFGPSYQFRFLAEPKRSYTLEYGSTQDTFALLDTAALDAAMHSGLEPIDGRLSDKVLERETIVEDNEPLLDHVLTTTWILYPLIGILLFLLVAGLVYAAKRMPKMEEGEEDK